MTRYDYDLEERRYHPTAEEYDEIPESHLSIILTYVLAVGLLAWTAVGLTLCARWPR